MLHDDLKAPIGCPKEYEKNLRDESSFLENKVDLKIPVKTKTKTETSEALSEIQIETIEKSEEAI